MTYIDPSHFGDFIAAAYAVALGSLVLFGYLSWRRQKNLAVQIETLRKARNLADSEE